MAISRVYHILARSSAVGALLLASQAYAQVQNAEAGSGDGAPDNIVVTARKQSETITDVPATINVVSPEALSGRRINTGLDLSGIVPGFQVVTGLAGSAEPRIRGLGSVTAVFSIEASVASFIDGIYAAHPRDYVSPSFDLERIEVIKGTQSTTLGKNATLGAISFVSRRPGKDLGFELSASQEFKFDSSRFEGAIDIPLGETLHARLAAVYSNEGGFIRNRYRGGREPTRRTVGGRLVTVWEPSDALKATLIYQHDRFKEIGQPVHLLTDGAGTATSASIAAIAAAIGQTNFDVKPGTSYDGYTTRPPFDVQNTDRATIIAEYDLGNFSLTSQTAYVNWTDRRRSDLDFTAGSLITFAVTEPNKFFSQELRMATPAEKPVNFVGGLYYMWNKYGVDQTIDAESPWPRAGATNHFYEHTVNSYSGFLQGNASLSEQIKLSAGGRLTRETKDGRFERTTIRPGSVTAIFAPFPEFSIKRKENNFDWNVSGQYYLDSRNVLYASASRGNKSGGFQTLPSNPALTEFEGERALTLETGVKSQLFGRVGLDVALFSTTVKDFQYVINTPQGNAVTNVKVRSRGVDAAVNWRPTRELRIDGGVVYADTRILEAFAGAPAGSRPSRAPVWSGNASIMYKVGLSDKLDLTVNPYVDFSSSQYNQLPSANAPKRQPYALVNARVAIGESNGNWELALIGKNLTNQQIFYTSTTPLLAGGPWYGNISTPATFALQITVKR